jgi:hypothetical protein
MLGTADGELGILWVNHGTVPKKKRRHRNDLRVASSEMMGRTNSVLVLVHAKFAEIKLPKTVEAAL